MAFYITQFAALSLLFLLSGVFWGSWLSIGRSFHEFPLSEFVHIAQIINRNLGVSMRIISIPCIILMILSAWLFPQKGFVEFLLYPCSILLIISALLITVLIEVPMNNKIISWTTESAPLNWKDIRKRWQFYNDIRTLISLLSFLIFTALYLKLF
ncbi:anthrone oxygenase family protein [Mucilaginibacter sp. X5P1]|uniref:DUF1772 domain-containing protein n=1 Tax=Mucilaginibacter sp. X5P1 TaxID=2723088 RepID=UPI001622734F|nr:DUF1772 domain-containing protein [Mucilaginibacter sp. X5P1]MBB6141954.1 putative membrane protein [Mucilaginibacter sp. X5P1]